MSIADHPICPAHHYPCDHPQLCDGYCDISAEPITPHDKAARQFWASTPGYSHTLIEPQEPDQPDQEWMSWKGFLVGCALVLVAFAVAYGATK